jgi:hypothetical protein
MSSTTRAGHHPSGLIQELLFAGMFLWISVVSGTSLVGTDRPSSYPLLVVVTVLTGAFALMLARSAVGRWRGGERIALVHAGPFIAVVELAIGGSMSKSALDMADHSPMFSALIGVMGVGLFVAGLLDLAYWLHRRIRRFQASH